jgi:hypothetical protein
MDQLREHIENLLYPELRLYQRRDRDRVLREAREESLDYLEWAGILAALVIVVTIMRYSVVDLAPQVAEATSAIRVATPLWR